MDDLSRQAILNYLKANEYFSKIKDVEKKLGAWIDAYPIDLLAEIKKANAWLVTKSARYNDYGRFLNSWLTTATGSTPARPASVNEILEALSVRLKIMDKKLIPKTIDEAARLRELKEQLQEKIKREGKNAKIETEK